jgi:hypothetical protein
VGSSLIRHMRSNLIAYLALLLALGGTATAAANLVIPRNSVRSAQVADHSLQRVDFANGTLLQGPRGFRGPAGSRGAKGDPGPAAVSAGTPVLSVITATATMGGLTGTAARAAATCPEGTSVVGGGYLIPPNARPDLDIVVRESRSTPLPGDLPSDPPNSWIVFAYVKNASPIRGVDALPGITIVARCARVELVP